MTRRNWSRVTVEKRYGHRRNETVPVIGSAAKRCWCGDVIGHEWYGKYAGLPHPPADKEE